MISPLLTTNLGVILRLLLIRRAEASVTAHGVNTINPQRPLALVY
jgi:hypothetical protein